MKDFPKLSSLAEGGKRDGNEGMAQVGRTRQGTTSLRKDCCLRVGRGFGYGKFDGIAIVDMDSDVRLNISGSLYRELQKSIWQLRSLPKVGIP